MTVIFHTNAGTPVLAGDMLLSMAGPNVRTDLKLPSQPNGIVSPSNAIPNFIPVKMRRKIFVVNGHMAVGAAGTVLYIQMFLDALFDEFSDNDKFTRFELETFLQRYASSNQGQEVMDQIGMLIVAEATDWHGSLSKGLSNRAEVLSRRFGRVVTIGTGADAILEEIDSLDNRYQYGESQPPDGRTQFPEFGALSSNLVLLANVYWKEFISPNNVFDAWGGAYDLIYQDSNKVFQHLGDYTIFLRVFNGESPEKGIQLKNVLRYERRPDLSYITMVNDGQLAFFGAKDITASDKPISIGFGKDDLTMNSQVHISIIDVGKGNMLLKPLIQIDGLDSTRQGKQTVFTDFDDEGRLRVFFQAAHDEWLLEQASTYYENHAHLWS